MVVNVTLYSVRSSDRSAVSLYRAADILALESDAHEMPGCGNTASINIPNARLHSYRNVHVLSSTSRVNYPIVKNIKRDVRSQAYRCRVPCAASRSGVEADVVVIGGGMPRLVWNEKYLEEREDSHMAVTQV